MLINIKNLPKPKPSSDNLHIGGNMSYYSRHNSNSFSWEFFALGVLLLIVLLFMRSCISYNVWNDGVCSYCGGHYKFQQAIGHRNYTDYMYTCDKCGRSIEIGEHYLEVQNETTTR